MKLYYKYSELDREHQFGLVENETDGKAFPFWILFYLGSWCEFAKLCMGCDFTLYPYVPQNSKLIRNYTTNDGEKQAKYIFKQIKKRL